VRVGRLFERERAFDQWLYAARLDPGPDMALDLASKPRFLVRIARAQRRP